MGIQATASKSDLLLKCVRPFEHDVPVDERNPTEAMLYGTRFHEEMYKAVFETENWYVNTPDSALKEHVVRAASCLSSWSAVNGITWASGEQSIKRGLRRGVHDVKLDLASHTYDPLGIREIAGTYDLLSHRQNGKRVVLDYKTGMGWGQPLESPSLLPQMLTLAWFTNSTHVAVLHTPVDAPPVIYEDEVSKSQLQTHIKALRAALNRIGDGSMTPGAHCRRCPTQSSCPTQVGTMLVRTERLLQKATKHDALVGHASAPIAQRTPEEVGQLHMLLGEFDKVVRTAREEIRNRVLNGDVVIRPDGKVLTFIEKNYERLSKSSILEALGPIEGGKILDLLRSNGCLTSESRTELHAK